MKKIGSILLMLFGVVMGCVWIYNGVAPIMGTFVLILSVFLTYMLATDKLEP